MRSNLGLKVSKAHSWPATHRFLNRLPKFEFVTDRSNEVHIPSAVIVSKNECSNRVMLNRSAHAAICQFQRSSWRPRTTAESDVSEMPLKMQGRVFLPSILALAVGSFLIAGCASGTLTTNSTNGNSTSPTGSSFVVGTDAPMASVTSFAVQLSAMNAYTSTDCSGTGVSLLSGTPTVDFARFNGLQTLIDMNDVAPGTYNCVSITLGPATLGYLDTSSGGAPTITSEAATLPTAPLTYPLTNPMVVAQAGAPVGLHMDFDLRKSIEVDSNGNITGAVNPTFNVKAVNNSDPGAYIDEFDAAVIARSEERRVGKECRSRWSP